jgi:hypothetical protein
MTYDDARGKERTERQVASNDNHFSLLICSKSICKRWRMMTHEAKNEKKVKMRRTIFTLGCWSVQNQYVRMMTHETKNEKNKHIGWRNAKESSIQNQSWIEDTTRSFDNQNTYLWGMKWNKTWIPSVEFSDVLVKFDFWRWKSWVFWRTMVKFDFWRWKSWRIAWNQTQRS